MKRPFGVPRKDPPDRDASLDSVEFAGLAPNCLALGATSRLTDRRHGRVILGCSGRAEVATHQGHSALLRVPALADCLLNGPSDCSACQSEKPTKNRCRYAQFKDREPSGLPVNDEAYHEAYDAPEHYACCRTHHCPSDWQRESAKALNRPDASAGVGRIRPRS